MHGHKHVEMNDLAKNKYGLATILVPFLFNSGEQANICFS
jgi:hypothetical protein